MIKKMRFLLIVMIALLSMNESQGQISVKKGSLFPVVAVNDSQYVFVLSWDTDSLKLRTKRVLMSALKTNVRSGMGTVTSVSVVNSSAVITATVATGTVTPVITYTTNACAAYSVLANTTNATGVPVYSKIDLPNMTYGALPAAQMPATTAGYVWMGGSGGTTTGQPLSGDVTISSAGVVTHTVTGVSAGTYGGASSIPEITVDAKGRITAATSHSVTPASVTPTNTVTFTNKRWTPRVSTTTTVSATPSFNTDNYDIFEITAQNANITNVTTNISGTPVNGEVVGFRLTAASGSYTIAWGTKFVNSTVSMPTTITTTTQTVYFQYCSSCSQGTNVFVCAKTY